METEGIKCLKTLKTFLKEVKKRIIKVKFKRHCKRKVTFSTNAR